MITICPSVSYRVTQGWPGLWLQMGSWSMFLACSFLKIQKILKILEHKSKQMVPPFFSIYIYIYIYIIQKTYLYSTLFQLEKMPISEGEGPI